MTIRRERADALAVAGTSFRLTALAWSLGLAPTGARRAWLRRCPRRFVEDRRFFDTLAEYYML